MSMTSTLAALTLVLTGGLLAGQGQAQEASANPLAEAPGLVRVSDGEAQSVSDLLGERYTALHFLLMTECPICQRHTHQHAVAFADEAGIATVFLKPDDLPAIRGWTEGVEDAPEIYQDPDAALASFYDIPDGYRFHRKTIHYPALILLDAEGNEVWRFVGESTYQRVSVERLTEVITALDAGQQPK